MPLCHPRPTHDQHSGKSCVPPSSKLTPLVPPPTDGNDTVLVDQGGAHPRRYREAERVSPGQGAAGQRPCQQPRARQGRPPTGGGIAQHAGRGEHPGACGAAHDGHTYTEWHTVNTCMLPTCASSKHPSLQEKGIHRRSEHWRRTAPTAGVAAGARLGRLLCRHLHGTRSRGLEPAAACLKAGCLLG